MANDILEDTKNVCIQGAELSIEALTEGRLFDGLATGRFMDMNGRVVEFKPGELSEYLDHTLQAIEATRAESGELVGLPIDARGHDKGDGAGWIVDAQIEGEKIRFKPRWTHVGRELIEKGIRRFFSATVDTVNKVVLGGTLTNWPATRDKSGRILLRPVELSGKEEVLMADENTITIDQLKELINAAVAEAIQAQSPTEPPVEMSAEERETQMAELREQYRTQVRIELEREYAAMQHKTQVAELANALVGGFDGAPRGYRADAAELQSHLAKLEPDEAAFWGNLLKKTQADGFIEFGEVGSGKNPKSGSSLEPWAERYLSQWVEGGGSIEEFFSVNADVLGDATQYNLQAFNKEK